MRRIYSILVENRSGVLCKVAGLFWRRCFNIESIVVGETDDKSVSNMIIVSSGDEHLVDRCFGLSDAIATLVEAFAA